eukprot:GHVS01078630.1.p1 GENE.GHVS01078630.1~~GHVS01078630.1.p1  ORF type:complete len:552 (-),score=83.87 GHVS01078630.1:199-1833(-)
MASFPGLCNYPVMFQVNCRVLLRELADLRGGGKCTLDDIPDFCLDRWKQTIQPDVLYLLGVWTTGEQGKNKAREVMQPLHLPHDQICSSPFAVTSYEVHPDFGGDEALERFRHRLSLRGIGLLLDFVPNHIAIDHPWTRNALEVKDFLMPGNADQLSREPHNFHKLSCGEIIAHGKDPHFDGWTDTAQLNYFSRPLREAQKTVLLKICNQADAVRCDMAMLVCSEQMINTWGERYRDATGHSPNKPACEFWTEVISAVKAVKPDFAFMAEVYWNLEAQLMQQGFDFCYDKDLYDKLLANDYGAVRHDISSRSLHHQQGLVRFIENHDEDRCAATLPNLAQHRAAAALCYLSPGLKFFHHGQLEGRKQRMQMQREKLPQEKVSAEVKDLYIRLLDVLKCQVMREGFYYSLDVNPSSHESTSHHSLIALLYLARATPPAILVVVNYNGHSHANGFVRLNCGCGSQTPVQFSKKAGAPALSANLIEALSTCLGGGGEFGIGAVEDVLLRDVFGTVESYGRNLQEFAQKGIWFNLPPWGTHVFQITSM